MTANAPCAQVMAEMNARVDGQSTGSEDALGTVGRKGPSKGAPEKGWVSGLEIHISPTFPMYDREYSIYNRAYNSLY